MSNTNKFLLDYFTIKYAFPWKREKFAISNHMHWAWQTFLENFLKPHREVLAQK